MARIVITEPVAEEGVRILQQHAEVDLLFGLSYEELVGAVSDYEGLLVRSATRVTREVVEAAKNLKVIGRAGTGLNNIDTLAARERGIKVVDASGANAISAAEHTFALLLAVCRKIARANRALVIEKRWDRHEFVGIELYGKCLGIIGFGRIGKEVAKRAIAFGMTVIAFDPYVATDEFALYGVCPVTFKELLTTSDFITIHVPLTDETRSMIGKSELSLLKKGSILINCARGEVVDEPALYDALIRGDLAGAGIDVFAKEPAIGNPLLELDNVVATPHLGGSTVEAQQRCAVVVARLMVEALNGDGSKVQRISTVPRFRQSV